MTGVAERADVADARALLSARPQMSAVVPIDRMRIARITAMSIYLAVYLYWLRTEGLPIDRISVAISLFLFLVCAFIGKPLLTWAILIIDVACYAVMWIAYEQTRGRADQLDFPRQLAAMRNIDRFLFFGHDPNVVLQNWLWRPTVQWYDWIFSSAYYSHFVFPVVVMAVLWAVSHRQWTRFMKRFATLLFVACLMFVYLPTIPPWMAGDTQRFSYRVLPPLHRDTWKGFYDLGFKGFVKSWRKGLNWGNEIAAMPSLHASFALITVAFFLPWIQRTWVKALMLCWPVVMLFALVLYGEHWIIDGIAGWVITGLSFLLWNRIERAIRRNRSKRARTALLALGTPAPMAHAG